MPVGHVVVKGVQRWTRFEIRAGRALALALWIASALGFASLLGCTPTGMPREFGEAGKALIVSLTDQAAWQTIIGRLEGQAIEPGIEGYAGVLYVAGGKLRGFSGQVGISGTGTGTGQPSAEALAKIRDLIRADPTLLDGVKTIIDEVRPAPPIP